MNLAALTASCNESGCFTRCHVLCCAAPIVQWLWPPCPQMQWPLMFCPDVKWLWFSCPRRAMVLLAVLPLSAALNIADVLFLTKSSSCAMVLADWSSTSNGCGRPASNVQWNLLSCPRRAFAFPVLPQVQGNLLSCPGRPMALAVHPPSSTLNIDVMQPPLKISLVCNGFGRPVSKLQWFWLYCPWRAIVLAVLPQVQWNCLPCPQMQRLLRCCPGVAAKALVVLPPNAMALVILPPTCNTFGCPFLIAAFNMAVLPPPPPEEELLVHCFSSYNLNLQCLWPSCPKCNKSKFIAPPPPKCNRFCAPDFLPTWYAA